MNEVIVRRRLLGAADVIAASDAAEAQAEAQATETANKPTSAGLSAGTKLGIIGTTAIAVHTVVGVGVAASDRRGWRWAAAGVLVADALFIGYATWFAANLSASAK